MLGFTFDDKHSYNDFGLILEEHNIQPPKKIKVLSNVPGMSSYYDFSTVASNGEQVFDTRAITAKVLFVQPDTTKLYSLYTRVLEWLMSVGKCKLIFDFLQGYYFLAEVQNAPSWEELNETGELTITFVAEPYKYSTELSGELLWDNIDFYLPDYIQDTKFNISKSKTITLYSSGTKPVIPEIITDSSMACTINGYTATFSTDNSVDYDFKLQKGANIINIVGNGDIQFNFRKEVL